MKRLLAAGIVLAVMALLPLRPQTGHADPTGSTVHYAAGWNLVAAPTGSLLAGAASPYYAFGPGATDYQPLAPGDVVGGRAVWAYFAAGTDIALGATAASFTSVLAPPSQWVLIGNPSSSTALPLNGADAAMAYDSTLGYTAVASLQPGQGAWVLSFSGGLVSVGAAPLGAAANEIRRFQVALTSNPTDRGNLDRIAATTSELLRSRQYDQVQSAVDDLWSAGADGLREQGSGSLPSLSNRQRVAASEIREDLAVAFAAAQAGDFAAADRAVEKAKAAAQASEDNGVEIARGQGGGEQSFVFASAGRDPTARRDAANSLAAFGALLHSAFFSIALGHAPSNDLWNVATALLTGTPVPRSGAGTATPSPMAPSAAPAPVIDSLTCSPLVLNTGDNVNCTVTAHGQVTAITWAAPNGMPASGAGVVFGTSYDSPGTQVITVTVCNGAVCLSRSQNLDVLRKQASPTPSPVPQRQPITLTGTIQVTEGDVNCSFSAMPSSTGTITITLPFGTSPGDPIVANGSFSGGTSGSRTVRCASGTATESFQASYSANFNGVVPSGGAITLNGRISVTQSSSFSNCKDNSGAPAACPPPAMSTSYPVTVLGTITIPPSGQLASGSGSLDMSKSGCSTTGQWSAH